MSYMMCRHIGISGVTEPFTVVYRDGSWEARVWISIFGFVNPQHPDFPLPENPFHPDFYDNYASGVGATEEDALEAMSEDMKSMSRTLI